MGHPFTKWGISLGRCRCSEMGKFRNHFRVWLLVTKKSRRLLLGCADEADSVTRRPTGCFDFAGRGGALGGVALSVRCGGGVCESGGEDFLCYFRVSDYDFVVEGVWENFDDWVAGILCAAGVPDFAGGDCVHVGSVCDFLA